MDDIFDLNVGGCLYTTTRSTLTRYPDSMLGAMFSGELNPSVCDATGAYVMDRDGPIFRHVLNFLRQGKLILPENFKEWEQLASEADFYQVGALVEAVKAEKYRRTTQEELEYFEEYFQLTVCANVHYTCSGNTSEEVLWNFKPLREFFQAHSHKIFDGVLKIPPDIETNVHEDFERRKSMIFEDIFNKGFRLLERSYTFNAAGVKEFIWKFARPVRI